MKTGNQVVAKRINETSEIWRGVRRAEPVLQFRRLMREKKLRNLDVAERLGISEANVSRLLRGNQNLKLDTLYSLADAIGEPLTIAFGELFAGNSAARVESGSGTTGQWKTDYSLFDATNVHDLSAYRVRRERSAGNFNGKEQANYGCFAVGG